VRAMTRRNVQPASKDAWALVAEQHGVVSRRQLAELGFSRDAIAHRVAKGRLHLVWPGVFAVGRPELSDCGRWMAAVLACGPDAALSHGAAAALWRMAREPVGPIAVSVPANRRPRPPTGVEVHRRSGLGAADVTTHRGIPVTAPVATLIDLAVGATAGEIERAVNEADKHDLIDPETLRAALDAAVPRPGTARLRKLLDRHTFALTDSDLERRFLRLALRAGLPPPETGAWLNGFKVDFHWLDLGLVVETDGLRYHRTPAQQAADRLRDQVHTAAGLTTLRFTHAQVAYESDWVRETLAAVAR
jgi:uncharacterized protein DUF559/transcriptional regulator with AbiEi antitoxin domain of type IV toxin-antitoxin system